MSRIRGLVHRLRVLIDPDRYAQEVEREIRFHLDREAMHQRGEGVDEPAAWDAARRRFGNVTYVREEVRSMSGMDWIDRIRQNLTYATRGLRRSPGFTAAVVLTLGLGLGVNAAMFTFLDRLFVKAPAGVVNPSEVRRVYALLYDPEEGAMRAAGILRQMAGVEAGRRVLPALWYTQARELRRADSSIVFGLFRNRNDSVVVKVGESTFKVQQGFADADYFRVLGARPQIGRLFDRNEDDIARQAPVAIISDAMWERAFARNPQVIGSTFFIKYRPITVVGVAPKNFSGIELDRTDYWLPLGNFARGLIRDVPWYDSYRAQFSAVTRTPDEQSEQRFLQLGSQVASAIRPVMLADSIVHLLTGPLQATLGPAKTGKEVAISIRLGGVALIILLITLANVSNLLLVRATRREREIAVRRALGVSRGRLIEQLLTESVLLSIFGGAVALVLAIWVGTTLRALLLPEVHWPAGVLDARVATFSFLAAVLAGIVVGLVPAISTWRPDLLSSLRAGTRNGSYHGSPLRNGLLVAQAALSVMLLVGSGLFVRSLQNVRRIDVGFDFEQVHFLRVSADTGTVSREVFAAQPEIVRRLRAIPGVEGVTLASQFPMMAERFEHVTRPGLDSAPQVLGTRLVTKRSVAPGYFSVIGQRMVAGREFSASDPPSAVISKEMADAYWPGESALGKCLLVGQENPRCYAVLGVTVTTNRYRIVDDERMAQMYLKGDSMPAVILRVAPERRAQVAPLVAAEVKRLVPRAAVVEVHPLAAEYEDQFRPWRLGATLFTAMGLLALIVAAIGVYSVIAYATTQRTNEMGIRIALGARLADIARLVVSDGLRTITIGILLGVGLALAAGKLVASLLYGITPRDPVVMLSAALVLALMGIAACVIPALRAARVDPVSALRAD